MDGAVAAWTRCRPYIEAALAHSGGTHTIDDVQAGIERGEFHFWPGQRCAVVTEIWTAPRIDRLNVWLAGGDLREIRRMVPSIEAFARASGCGALIAGALAERAGWSRIAAGLGFSPGWTIYTKELP